MQQGKLVDEYTRKIDNLKNFEKKPRVYKAQGKLNSSEYKRIYNKCYFHYRMKNHFNNLCCFLDEKKPVAVTYVTYNRKTKTIQLRYRILF